MNEQQQNPASAPLPHSDVPLVAADRGQKQPQPAPPGARKGNAQDALVFFGGGFQKR